jgi:hypothetical protein
VAPKKCAEIAKGSGEILAIFAGEGRFFQCSRAAIPVFGVQRAHLDQLLPGTVGSIELNFTPSNSWKVAKFNSGGPSDVGLLKPDIMAPGSDIASTKASTRTPSECGARSLLRKTGSSIAVPVVSGAAALLVQYFRDGSFPRAMAPSAMLMKALLVNGAVPRDSAPNLRKGFGMLRLDNVMAFNDSDFKLLVADFLNISVGVQLCATVVVVAEGNFTVSMSWNDPPVNRLSVFPLYADLDLIVETPDKAVLYSNECRQTSERVFIAMARPGEYRIRVVCHEYFEAMEIQLAVAATGHFRGSGMLPFTRQNSEPRKCKPLKTGHNCEFDVVDGFSGNFAQQSRQFQYFSIEVPKLARGQYLELVLEIPGARRGNVQIELSHRQIAKFGGRLIKFQRVWHPSVKFRISEATVENLTAGDRVYFSFFEATDRGRKFTLRSHVKVNRSVDSYAELSTPSRSRSLANRTRMARLGQQSFSSKGRQVVVVFALTTTMLVAIAIRRVITGSEGKMKSDEFLRVSESNLANVRFTPGLAPPLRKKNVFKGSERLRSIDEGWGQSALDGESSAEADT